MRSVKTGLLAIIAVLVTALGLAAYFVRNAAAGPVVRTEYLMGTLIEITAYGKDAETAIEAAFTRMRAIERRAGGSASSDLARLNARAGKGKVRITGDTRAILSKSMAYWRATEGAFDVTVGPLVRLWDFDFEGEGRLPGAAEIERTLPLVGGEKLILNEKDNEAALARAGMIADVGGVAKGYAVEEAVKVLQGHGIENAMVNGGNSSIKVIGRGPKGRGWRIGIGDPRRAGELLGVVTLRSGEAVGTSSDSQRFFVRNGTRYSHLIDPRTGYPARKAILATVIANDATEADILSTAFFVNGPAWSLAYAKKAGIKAFFVDAKGKTKASPGLVLGQPYEPR